jgi:hypothetical protein
MSRRGFCGLLPAAVLIAGHPAMAWAAPGAASGLALRPLRFDIVWSKDRIGSHVVTFEQSGGELFVRTHIDVEVRLMWMTLFKYAHQSIETWNDRRLVSFESQTDDNGRKESVTGKAREDGFESTGRKGTVLAPPDIMVGTFWNPEILNRTVILDPQKGILRDQIVHGHDRTTLTVSGESRLVDGYRVSSLMDGTIYYDDNSKWIGAIFKKKGGMVLYRYNDPI